MAQTRLRGLEIAGIQIGIEVPSHCVWDWPNAPVADYQCLPRNPEVHVGVRVAEIDDDPLDGECHAIGAWKLEVARRGTDWRLALSRRGRRTQIADFDREFTNGEVVLSPEEASLRGYPLRGPLDEWIVLHRLVAAGGLCLTGQAAASGGRAALRLGSALGSPNGRWLSATSSLLGRQVVALRPLRGQLRMCRTPWSESIDPVLGIDAPVFEIGHSPDALLGDRNVLGSDEAADLLLRHAVLPFSDEALYERVLRNARRIAHGVPVVELPASGSESKAASWRSRGLSRAGVAPRNHAL